MSAEDRVPFVLPWNDASSGITDMSDLSKKPAGKYGFIAASEAGHFMEGDKRIRFLGVNITAASCFPEKDKADQIAARLAKFGINSVRFHHMEAPWDKKNVLIDYSVGGSSKISPDRLDRLHYFISKLKEHGIYADINLLVSRDFSSADGFPKELDTMSWKEKHVLAFFNDKMLELEKKYASDLLTSKNPYTDLSLAQDPGVAIVEIMNENGLIHSWMGGELERVPQVFLADLQQQWNGWLRKRYSNSASVVKAWNIKDIPLGKNLLSNGDFSKNSDGWYFERHGKADAEAVYAKDFNGKPSISVDVKSPGTESWHAQFSQGNLVTSPDTVYTVSFWAKASAKCAMQNSLQNTHDYKVRDYQQSCDLTEEWKFYTKSFQTISEQKDLRLSFSGFGNLVVKVWVADVKFQKGGKIGELPEGLSLEKSNFPIFLRKGNNLSYTPEMKSDWIRFLSDVEKNYWMVMRDYIKGTLGYRGIVMGTIIANSPPNIQSGMDAIDGHSYWAHPHFPHKPWDRNDWTIETRPMVDVPEHSTISSLAGQRVHGKPFTVTEYQHAFPNAYTAEGPITAGAYAAFQDWDGIWFFDYGDGNKWDMGYIPGFFDMNQHPTKMANMILAAQLFRRSDASPAREIISYNLSPEREIKVMSEKGHAWHLASASHLGMDYKIPLTHRVELNLAKVDQDTSLPSAESRDEKVFEADTREIFWDGSNRDGGLMTVNTPRTKALVGRLSKLCSFDKITVEAINPNQWLTFGLTIKDQKKNFSDISGWEALTVVTGKIENTEMGWKNEKKNFLGNDWGKSPTLIEIVPLKLKLPFAASRVSVFALDETGQRKTPVKIQGDNSNAEILLGYEGKGSLWYEIIVAPNDFLQTL